MRDSARLGTHDFTHDTRLSTYDTQQIGTPFWLQA